MTIAVVASDLQWRELISMNNNAELARISALSEMPAAAEGCLWLKEVMPAELAAAGKPVLVNAVIATLKEMDTPANVSRINGWSGFLARNTWEIAGAANEFWKAVGEQLGKRLISVPDEPGFVAARIISMIINEAYFALGDKISTTAEIDTAMKYGTNYPLGPFEWAAVIGTGNVYALLQKLSVGSERYTPAPRLKAAAGL